MGLLLAIGLVFLGAEGVTAPKIAIFAEPDFPYYMAAPTDSPRAYQELFQEVGLEAELITFADLLRPEEFNARKYAVYVHPCGNTFPVEAFGALVDFHEAGGSIVVPSGVPFCHPCVARGAASWAFGFGADGGRVVGQAHSGAAAFEVYNPRGRDWTGPNSPRFGVRPGEKYVVGGWVKHDEEFTPHDNTRIFLRFFDAQGRFIGQQGPRIPDKPCDWTELKMEVTAMPGAATADVSPQLWAQEGRLLLDDLFLYVADETVNLIANSSFEEAAGGWHDLGHRDVYQRHDQGGLGTGGFVTVTKPGGFQVTSLGEALGLGALAWGQLAPPDLVQTLDVTSLPPEDEVRPLVSVGQPAANLYPSVIIAHHCPRFNGAYDLWGRGNCPAIDSWRLFRITVAGTIEILRLRSLISDGEAKAMLARLEHALVGAGTTVEPVSEPRPYETIWPRSQRPADTIFVCDLSKADPAEEFALTVLQGLVNREQPRLYIVHTRYDKQDRQWLDELRFEGLNTEQISPQEAWQKFGATAKGVVLYDREALKEIGAFRAERLNVTNVVLMLCAVNDAVPLALGAGEKAPADRAVIFDTHGRWHTPLEMYQWAYENLWPKMNHHILASLYPGIFYLTDYLVQHRVFTFWFGGDRTIKEQRLLDRILASTPPNTPIIGWWFCWMPNVQDPNHAAADCVGEGEGVRLGSTYAKFLTVSHEATNLSVHSGMPPLGYRHKPISQPTTLDPSKVYYAFIISDGDNLGEALMMRFREFWWDTPERGKVPMGWSFAPATAVLAPPVLNYYLRTASEADLLVGGLGIGYTHPDAYAGAYPAQRDAIFAEYARLTADSLAPLDTGALWLIGGSRENLTRYAQAGRPLTTIFPDYGAGKRPYSEITYMDVNQVAVFRAATSTGGNVVERLVREIRAAHDGQRPAFLHVFLMNWEVRLPQLLEVMEKLGPDYVAVRPDELDRLFREWMKRSR